MTKVGSKHWAKDDQNFGANIEQKMQSLDNDVICLENFEPNYQNSDQDVVCLDNVEPQKENSDEDVICLGKIRAKEDLVSLEAAIEAPSSQGLIFYTFPHLLAEECEEIPEKATAVSSECQTIEQCLDNVESLFSSKTSAQGFTSGIQTSVSGLDVNNKLIFYTYPNLLCQDSDENSTDEVVLSSNEKISLYEEASHVDTTPSNDDSLQFETKNLTFYTFPNLSSQEPSDNLEANAENQGKQSKVLDVLREEEIQEEDNSISTCDPMESELNIMISNVITLTKGSKRKSLHQAKSLRVISHSDMNVTKKKTVSQIKFSTDQTLGTDSSNEFDESIFDEIEKEIQKRTQELPPLSTFKKYRCLFCRKKFKSTIEAKIHQMAIHQVSWS